MFSPAILVALLSCTNGTYTLDFNWTKGVSVVVKNSSGAILLNESAKGSFDPKDVSFKSKHSKGSIDLKKGLAEVKFEAAGMEILISELSCK